MDLIGGLSAARLALDIAKDLREIDASVDQAQYKLKLADLTSALADAQIALSDAKLELNKLTEQLASKDAELDALNNGERCPKCRTGRLEMESFEPVYWKGLNELGVEKHFFKCGDESCDFVIARTVDPHGVVGKVASKL